MPDRKGFSVGAWLGMAALLVAATAAAVYLAYAPKCAQPNAITPERLVADSKRVNDSLVAARQKEAQLKLQADDARRAEEEGRKSGNAAKQLELEKQRANAEARLNAQAAYAKQRERQSKRVEEMISAQGGLLVKTGVTRYLPCRG